MEEKTLLLLGKTGNGKSSTGNAILGRDGAFQSKSESAFAASSDTTSETVWIHCTEHTRCRDQNNQEMMIRVVDCPGFFDTRLPSPTSNILLHEGILKAFVTCPEGFDAMLIVLRFGNRFTEEEVNTIQILKLLFGQNVVKKHCLLVFTHGEQMDIETRSNVLRRSEQEAASEQATPLEEEKKEKRRLFEKWLRDQKGPLGALISECGIDRCLLFRNLSEHWYDAQRVDLLEKIKHLQRYTNDLLQKVKERRDRFIEQQTAVLLKDTLQKSLSLLQDSLNGVRKRLATKNEQEIKSSLHILQLDAKNAKEEIERVDKEGEALKDLLSVVGDVLVAVKSMLSERDSDPIDKVKSLKSLQECLARTIHECRTTKAYRKAIVANVVKDLKKKLPSVGKNVQSQGETSV